MATKKKIKVKNKAKSHEIRTFEDLDNIVTEENVDMIMGNFYGVIKSLLLARKTIPNIKLLGFTWIDDGKIEVKSVNFIVNTKNK